LSSALLSFFVSFSFLYSAESARTDCIRGISMTPVWFFFFSFSQVFFLPPLRAERRIAAPKDSEVGPVFLLPFSPLRRPFSFFRLESGVED